MYPPQPATSRSHTGFCGPTNYKRECATGPSGAFKLTSLSACKGQCQLCDACNFISFSAKNRDCSWYETCDLSSLGGGGAEEAYGISAEAYRTFDMRDVRKRLRRKLCNRLRRKQCRNRRECTNLLPQQKGATKHSARATTPRASPGLVLPVPAPQLRHNFTATSPRHALARFPDAAAAVLPVGLRPVGVAPAPVPTNAPIDACVVPRVVSITSITSACWVLPDGDDNLNFSSSDMEDDSVGDSDVSADTTTSLDSSGSCGGQWWTTEAIQLTPVTSPGAGPLQDEWPSTQKLGRVLSASSLELPPLAAPAQRAAGLQPECIVRRLSDEECDVDIGFGAPLFAL